MSRTPSLRLLALGTICIVFTAGCTAAKYSGEKNRSTRSDFGGPERRSDYWPRPDPDQALRYAKSVVLVRRVAQGDQVHSYVKEVWRFESGTEMPLPIGSNYGSPFPYDSRMRLPVRDALVFKFGADRPAGVPATWILVINDEGKVSPFEKPSYERLGLRGAGDADTVLVSSSDAMTLDELRQAVRNTNAKSD